MMFGYFGKGYYAPPPAGGEAEAKAEAKTKAKAKSGSGSPCGPPSRQLCRVGKKLQPKICVDGAWTCPPSKFAPRGFSPTTPAAPAAPVAYSKLAALREAIRAKRARAEKTAESEEAAKLAAHRARQAKQAAYGRGASSKGKRSESEIAIGVSSGYYGYDHHFGNFGDEINQISAEVLQATQIVKSLTKDVNAGMAKPEELEAAIVALNKKVKLAKALAKEKGLSGLGEEKTSRKPIFAILAVCLIVWFLFLR